MKYIISRNGSPVIFSEAETHAEIARSVGGAVSGGFIKIHMDPSNEDQPLRASCYGKSTSLGLDSRPGEDNRIITRMLNSY